MEFKEGDTVIFWKAHPSHNRYLKKRVGQKGTIHDTHENVEEYIVDFKSASFWIKPQYLKKAND